MSKRKKNARRRPQASKRVHVVPEPYDTPDARKLSRAFLALALHQAAREAAAQGDDATTADQEDSDDGRS